MDILVIGGGGREHALVWRLRQSAAAGKIYCAPGNAGIARIAECLPLGTCEEVIEFCGKRGIGLVVIGPEAPLVAGWSDGLRAKGILVFGPSAQAASLEASKAFTKRLCLKHHIPTADYAEFTELEPAKAWLATKEFPIVVKADGLAAGKGVVIAQDQAEAEKAVEAMLGGAFGGAGERVVIEEFLTGPEVSFFALCDGEDAIPFGTAQDHKRAFDGDLGPNTGGMGTCSPAPLFTPALQEEVMTRIIRPTLQAMREAGTPFQGVLFAGLMLTRNGPKLLEYNARFGDPETQSLMLRLDSDLLALLLACAKGGIGRQSVKMREESAVCVVMAAKGYPGIYEKGTVIKGLEEAASLPETQIFHASTMVKDGHITATGGRVLGVSALGPNMQRARARAYEAVERIDWPEGFCRSDIGAKI